MTLDTSPKNTDFNSDQRALAVNNLTLAHIARDAPLAQTLACIAGGLEDQNPGMAIAILLLDEDTNHFKLGAAPGLAPDLALDHCRAIDGIAGDAGIRIPSETIASTQFWRDFCASALQHGLHACSMVPIRSAANGMLGVFVAYSKEPGRADDDHRQAIADATALASIAIERAGIKKAENARRESETQMALAIEGSGTGIWDRNVLTGEIHYSAGWKAILGYEASELTNRIEESYTRLHPDDLACVQAAMQAHFDQKTESYSVEHRIRCKDGSYKWISSRGKVVSRDAHGKALRMIGTTTDVTEMRALSERLQQSVDLITCLTNEIPGMVYQYRLLPNSEAFFSYVSEGVRDIYEITPEQAADNPSLIDALIHPDDFGNYRASLDAAAAGLTPWHLEYRVILPRQGLRWRNGNARPQRLDDGSTLWHGFVTDVTERKRIEIELQEFATTDFLTQLPNRRHFMARMEEELAQIQSIAGTHAAILMCDLDHFKHINDSYGHAIGDRVLKHFAAILRSELRKSDTVGRVGGEEFAVILSGADIATADIFARRLLNQVAETPLIAGDQTVSVTVSIGIAFIAATDASADASLSRSDMALYRAKEGGRNRIEISAD